MGQLSCFAPAKINLYLKVINKRPDGFHNIKTVFERVNLKDRLYFKTNQNGIIKIICDHPLIPTGPKNLVYRVAKLLQTEYGIKQGVTVRIEKNIPVAAGLAGGSTNAAATLTALNRLWSIGLTSKQMLAHARQIGSDVAFFLYNTSYALGTGRGDVIKTLPVKTKLWHVIALPRMKLYAGEIYGALNLQLTKKDDNANILIRQLKKNDINGISRFLTNDLEDPILKAAPRLENLKEKLVSLGAKGVMISGSGPSVFGITDSQAQARKIQTDLSRRFKQVYVVCTL